VVIKVFFTVLVLCTVAVVAVVLAIHFRVKRHLREEPGPPISPDVGLAGLQEQGDAQDKAASDTVAEDVKEKGRKQSS
jgi:hypothetical protein